MGSEQRLTNRLVKMWDALAELNPPPMYAQLNKGKISDVWQQCAVLQVEPFSKDPDNPTIAMKYVGETVKNLMPDLCEGQQKTLNMMERELKKLIANIPDVIRNIETVINSGTLVSKKNKVIKYRTCLLPFTDKTGGVAYIVVGFSWIEC